MNHPPAGPPADAGRNRFAFAFESPLHLWALPFGIAPSTTSVDVGDGHLTVRFGPWRLVTPLDNVVGAKITGPYRAWRVAGPVRLSTADDGITFATSTTRGVCITFRRPVPAALPVPLLRHSAATVTVVDAEGLVAALQEGGR